jgi:hypothetical protein
MAAECAETQQTLRDHGSALEAKAGGDPPARELRGALALHPP